jgi:hypothetical protein
LRGRGELRLTLDFLRRIVEEVEHTSTQANQRRTVGASTGSRDDFGGLLQRSPVDSRQDPI